MVLFPSVLVPFTEIRRLCFLAVIARDRDTATAMPPGVSIHNCFIVGWLLNHPISDHSAKLCNCANFGASPPANLHEGLTAIR
jgi:hypothetical protein